MDQPFDKRNDNPEAPDLEAPKSDDNNFGITAKDNKAAEKKPAEKNSTEKKSAEKKSEEKKIAEKKSSTSSIRKQARLFLACLCFRRGRLIRPEGISRKEIPATLKARMKQYPVPDRAPPPPLQSLC